VQVKGTDHAARLESFYGPQAHACESLLVSHKQANTLTEEKHRQLYTILSVRALHGSLVCFGGRQLFTIWNDADDKFRSSFLWGRKPMLAACAARLADKKDLVWVDLGGGTGVNFLTATCF